MNTRWRIVVPAILIVLAIIVSAFSDAKAGSIDALPTRPPVSPLPTLSPLPLPLPATVRISRQVYLPAIMGDAR